MKEATLRGFCLLENCRLMCNKEVNSLRTNIMAIQACVMCVPIVVLQLFPFGHPNKKLCKIELLLYIDFDKGGGVILILIF